MNDDVDGSASADEDEDDIQLDLGDDDDRTSHNNSVPPSNPDTAIDMIPPTATLTYHYADHTINDERDPQDECTNNQPSHGDGADEDRRGDESHDNGHIGTATGQLNMSSVRLHIPKSGSHPRSESAYNIPPALGLSPLTSSIK